VTATILES